MSTDRRILLGRVAGDFGVRGELKLLSWTDPRDAIFKYQPWILRSGQAEREVSGVRGRDTGKLLIAAFPGIESREQAEALKVAKETAEAIKVGDPRDEATVMGPLVSKLQFDKVQRLIQAGIDEGATLVTGGVGRPADLNRGWFVRPTVFGDVVNAMTISKEEIFGPVLAIQPYDSIEDAITQANDTVYGLAAFIAGPVEDAKPVARKLRAGTVNLNYPDWDTSAPFGGYKQSGNGREYADWGIHDFCEVKGIVGWGD